MQLLLPFGGVIGADTMKTKNQNWVANIFIIIATLARLLPHPANVTPVGAVSLVGGSKLNGIYKWAVPFVVLALSDYLLGIFKGVEPWSVVTPFIYGAFALNIFLGCFIKGEHRYLKLSGRESETLELVEFIEKYMRECQAFCDKKKISLTFTKHPRQLIAITDKNLFGYILQNVI